MECPNRYTSGKKEDTFIETDFDAMLQAAALTNSKKGKPSLKSFAYLLLLVCFFVLCAEESDDAARLGNQA
jgi:hypothetical protein